MSNERDMFALSSTLSLETPVSSMAVCLDTSRLSSPLEEGGIYFGYPLMEDRDFKMTLGEVIYASDNQDVVRVRMLITLGDDKKYTLTLASGQTEPTFLGEFESVRVMCNFPLQGDLGWEEIITDKWVEAHVRESAKRGRTSEGSGRGSEETGALEGALVGAGFSMEVINKLAAGIGREPRIGSIAVTLLNGLIYANCVETGHSPKPARNTKRWHMAVKDAAEVLGVTTGEAVQAPTNLENFLKGFENKMKEADKTASPAIDPNVALSYAQRSSDVTITTAIRNTFRFKNAFFRAMRGAVVWFREGLAPRGLNNKKYLELIEMMIGVAHPVQPWMSTRPTLPSKKKGKGGGKSDGKKTIDSEGMPLAAAVQIQASATCCMGFIVSNVTEMQMDLLEVKRVLYAYIIWHEAYQTVSSYEAKEAARNVKEGLVGAPPVAANAAMHAIFAEAAVEEEKVNDGAQAWMEDL